ncbi:response regulator transcription factor [Brevundimonas bacteroides]|uniref:response regulator transcription factor n=1 Tax=Brevundimonas bacteroides TaxID=74311 RepID=UPI00049611D1|nr:response regulator [Brevundimonas bacteroides]
MAVILIADDDPIVRATLSEYLGQAGHAVIEAADGDQALSKLDQTVDLLILDMLMPNKDGLETILQLRRSGNTIPILAVSSGGKMDRSTLLRPAEVFGANASMPKPILRAALLTKVTELLSEGTPP